MKSADEILSLVQHRKSQTGDTQTRMEEIRRLYNGEMDVDLPELQDNERAVAANLAQLGIDQMAMRVGSVIPYVSFAVDRIGSQAAKDKARTKRDVILNHWWKKSRVTSHVIPRRARWFFAFATAPVMLRPNGDGVPCWYDRHPIGTYPASMLQVGDIVPPNVAYSFKKSGDELAATYPDEMFRLVGRGELAPTYEVVEYVDSEQITCVVLNDSYGTSYATGTPVEVLHSMPNRAGIPLSVIPGRITLDKPLGQFDGLIGAYQLQARLMALYTIAQERAVFPETWIQSQPGMPRAEVLVTADPKEGIVGEIVGGTINKLDMSPSPITTNLIDRLEYIERASGAVPAEFSGQSGSNIRTGRRGDAVMSAAVDFRLQEAQIIFEQSLVEENKIAIAIAKAYGSGRQYSMYVPDRGKITYKPDIFDGDDTHDVRYAYAGADANSLTIAVGQKLGLEVLSRETAMALDPLVTDVEAEKDRIISESVQRAFLSSIQSQAADPNAAWQPMDFARFGELVETDKMGVYAAAMQVNKEVQERQQAQQQGQMQGAEMQPGLAMPGAPGAPVPPAAIQGANPSLGNLTSMLAQLRMPQMQTAAERQPLGQPAVV